VIVLDASAAVDLVTRSPDAPRIQARLAQAGGDWHAPHLIDIEVAHVLRRMAARGADAQDCRQALLGWLAFPAQRHSHAASVVRAWDLRQNFSSYDATYLALAEILGATLLTRDRRLASSLHHTIVEVI
jgi:predicted nucleic acid-binding protein